MNALAEKIEGVPVKPASQETLMLIRCALVEVDIETEMATFRRRGGCGEGTIDVPFADLVGEPDGARLLAEFHALILAAAPTMTTAATMAFAAKLVSRGVS
jgi:hypothetical protein